MKPRIALLPHRVRAAENSQEVHVVRHHDEFTHAKSLAVEMQERIGNDLGQPRPFE
jgi:hypothetical protein